MDKLHHAYVFMQVCTAILFCGIVVCGLAVLAMVLAEKREKKANKQ